MKAPTRLLPRWSAPAAHLASSAYGAIVALRNARFDQGIGVRRVTRPVISVGNVVVGGTGKSPVVRWIANWATERGITPLIALRGYRSRPSKRGDRGMSDEALEHQFLVPGVRLAVGADRFRTVSEAIARDPSIGVVILDDGFQHRALAREIDLVLVDGSRPELDGSLLPAGVCREPWASLARATGVIVTHSGEPNAARDQRIQSLHGRPALAWCTHDWEGLDVYSRQCHSRSTREPNAWLQGQRVAVWAGIAQPSALLDMVQSCGGDIVSVPPLRDHAHYGASAVGRLVSAAHRARATSIVLTNKDWVKVRLDCAAIDLPIAVPRLALRFSKGEAAVRALLENHLIAR